MSDIDKDIEILKEFTESDFCLYGQEEIIEATKNVLSTLKREKSKIKVLSKINKEIFDEKETWKKVAEKLAGDLEMFITAMINNEEIALNKDRIFLALNTNQSIKSLIIEEARKEVENGNKIN